MFSFLEPLEQWVNNSLLIDVLGFSFLVLIFIALTYGIFFFIDFLIQFSINYDEYKAWKKEKSSD